MYRLVLFAAILAPSIACDAVNGAINPLVAEGMILGVQAPEDDRLDLSGTDFDGGTAATVFLADATSVDNLEDAPVEGAEVSIRGPGDMGNVPVADSGDGLYTVLPTDGALAYMDNADWNVVAKREGVDENGVATVHLPPPANVAVPEEHTPGQPITLNVGGQGFTSVLVVVLDVETGEVTFSNQPEDIRAVYDFTHGNDEVTTFEVPGTAFPEQKIYALGVAGMQHTQGADLEGMNSLLTSFMAGKMVMKPVVTVQTDQ